MRYLMSMLMVYPAVVVADQAEPSLYSLKSKNVSGFVEHDGQTYTITPSTKFDCSMEVQNIKKHHAGEGFKGWQISFTLKPENSHEKVLDYTHDFYWNEKELGSPFEKDFLVDSSYYTDTSETAAWQNIIAQNGVATFKLTEFAGYTWRHFILTPSDDHTRIVKFEFKLEAFGNIDTQVICEEKKKQ